MKWPDLNPLRLPKQQRPIMQKPTFCILQLDKLIVSKPELEWCHCAVIGVTFSDLTEISTTHEENSDLYGLKWCSVPLIEHLPVWKQHKYIIQIGSCTYRPNLVKSEYDHAAWPSHVLRFVPCWKQISVFNLLKDHVHVYHPSDQVIIQLSIDWHIPGLNVWCGSNFTMASDFGKILQIPSVPG